MAEAGPSSSSIQSNSRSVTPPSPPRRASRIRFPADQNHAENKQYGSFQSLGLGVPPSLVGSRVGNGEGSLAFKLDDKRRRVRSVDGVDGFAPPRPKDANLGSSLSRRTVSLSRRGDQRDKFVKAVSNGLSESFSNEYDLYPAIMEDVQRALRLKARREARLRTLQSSPAHSDHRATPEIASLSSVSATSSPARGPAGPSFPRHTELSGDSEVDFSPAVGTTSLHPVPSSLNGGITLDWAVPPPEEARERRWSISITKRKGKEPSIASSKELVEKQLSVYADKLEQIRSRAKSHTLRKATITSDQLERKYQLLLPRGKAPGINLLDVTHWYRKQDDTVRATLDKMEPSTWMKHLWDKYGAPKIGNSAWCPTALVMEEYVKSHTTPHTMSTIPEDEVILPASPATPSFGDTRSPSTSTYSWTSPRNSLEPAISRKRSSYDAQVSFEPLVESGKESIGARSRHSSEGLSRNWRSAVTGGDSARSSLYSLISKGASPNSSRKHLRGLGRRLHRRPSDDALSSARNSASEQDGHSASDDGQYGHQKMATIRPNSRPTSLQLQSGDERSPFSTQGIDTKPSEDGTLHADMPDEPETATQSTTIFSDATSTTPRPIEEGHAQ
ncbi:hypothetical protein BC628DRAFT_1295658, partial [Trametes gibbosa]